MIGSIHKGAASVADPGVARLRTLVRQALGDEPGTLEVTGVQALKRRVMRVRLAGPDGERSVVAKRLDPLEARRTELLERRWFPAAGLVAHGPALLGVAGTARARWTWHVYEDLGENSLVGREDDAAAVECVVQLVARIHSHFAARPILAECRPFGSFAISFYSANLRDAVRSLDRLARSDAAFPEAQDALVHRLLDRLERLLEETPQRARALEESGGPETLLHADLFTSNAFALPSPTGMHPRLIDWDRAGVGPMSYDLSTFLLRFPRERRPWLVDLYAGALENGVWRLPSTERLNLLCETAELARYANRVIWPALAIARDGAAWGFPELAEVERWFETLEPILPS